MNDRKRAATYLVATSLSLCLAVPAWAAPGDEGAAGASDGDIIVTARRVEERLQDVPISMSVFSQQQLADRNIVTASDLGTYTPSLAVDQKYGPEKSSFTLRGFSQETGTAPSVGVYFADVVAPRAQGGTISGNNVGAGAFMDLQNVQILKGPQGTLQGRNTTGGAVLLVPQRPTDRLEGYVEATAGGYGLLRGLAVLNAPLSDTVRFRAGIDRNKREGYMKNHSGIGPDDYNDINYFAARASLVADITPDLENYTIFSYSNSFSRNYAMRMTICERTPENRIGGKIFTAQPACDQIDRQAARGDGPYDVEVDNPDPFLKIRQWQVINTTTWQVSDSVTIKNIASYAEYREKASYSLYSDNFFVTPPFPTVGAKFRYILVTPPPSGQGINASQKTFVDELQFQGISFDGRLTWQAGGYMELSRPLGFSTMYTGIFAYCTDTAALQCENPLGRGFVSASSTEHSFDNLGLYAQGTYQMTDQLSLTAGLRYTIDKTRAVGESVRYQLPPGAEPFAICDDTLRFQSPSGGPLVVTDKQQCHNEIRIKSSKPTWLIDIDYKPSDAVLLYAKWARGYRQGGISMTNIGIETWEPETVDAYEIGAKTSFRGAVSGYFNISAFYNDFRNQQIFGALIAKPDSGLVGGAGIINAGKSRIQGIEIDASVLPVVGLKFDIGYTYLDTELKAITLPTLAPDSPFSQIIPKAALGEQLNYSPKNRLSLSGSYTLPLDEAIGAISLGATYVHTDKQIANATSPIGTLSASDLVNLNVNWDNVMGQSVDLAFFVTNLTKDVYPVGVGGAWESAGLDTLLMGAPRMWGFRLRYSFGQ